MSKEKFLLVKVGGKTSPKRKAIIEKELDEWIADKQIQFAARSKMIREAAHRPITKKKK